MGAAEDEDYFLKNNHLQEVSVAFGSACLAAALLTLGALCRGLLLALRRRLRWEGPRSRVLGLVAVQLVLQTANLGLWMANMVISWTGSCTWFDRSVDIIACIQWTIWNCLFHINIVQASLLLPTGAWQALAETVRMRAKVWWRRCCCSAGNGHGAGSGASTVHGEESEACEEDGGSGDKSCGVKDVAEVVGSAGSNAASGAAVAIGSAAHAAAAGLAVLPGAAAVHGGAAAVADVAAPGVAAVASAAGAVAGAAVWLEERIRLSLMSAMLLLVWLPNQVLIVVLTVRIVGLRQWEWNGQACYDPSDPACAPPTTPCKDWGWQCHPDSSVLRLTYGVGALFLASALAFLLLTWLAFHQLGARPYRDWRVRNLALRIMLRTRVASYLLFVLTLALTFYARMGSCSSVILVWLGLGPMQVAMTATVVSEGVLFMPVRQPDAAAVKLHDALQRFAWIEGEVPALVADRGFREEPCFCVETALKCLYLSLHAYSRSQPGEPTDMATALRLYDCQHYEWLHEPVHDSNCLLAWGPDTLLVAFRGTSSLANVKADAKVWRTPHPPLRGSALLRGRPLVHLGFLVSWLFNGYNEKVLQRIRETLEGAQPHANLPSLDCTADRCCCGDAPPNEHLAAARAAAAAEQAAAQQDGSGGGRRYGGRGTTMRRQGRPFRIIITGHSLGGAMGTLCAIDLAKALPGWGLAAAPALLPLPADGPLAEGRLPADSTPLPCPAVSLSVYTFGAPRTGNHAFARDFNAHVPDCWSVINGQDVVANRGKFWVLFKRQGKPVLLSRRGDVIVRPSAIEHSAHTFSGASVKAHFLQDSYARSLAVFLALQLAGRGKALPGGPEAVAAMRADPAVAQVLERVVCVEAVQASHPSFSRSRKRTASSGSVGGARGEGTTRKNKCSSPGGGGLPAQTSACLDV
ncbi:hypothetical protein ABPG75_003654 [Micractinium tetrahymenae]